MFHGKIYTIKNTISIFIRVTRTSKAMQPTAIGTVANSLPENKVILLTLLISKRYISYTDLRIIFVTLHCLSRQTFENNRESASLLVKSPNLTKRICEARGTAHIRGLPIRACIQAFGDAYKSARMAAHFL